MNGVRSYDISALSGKELIIALSAIFGPSGCEEAISKTVAAEAEKYCDKVVFDRMGSVIGRISLGNEKKRKRIMLAAHLDEVGFMIEGINSDGYLTFDTVGGIDPSVLAGKRVLVGDGKKKFIQGVILSKAIHHKSSSERGEATDVEKLYIDIGVSSRADAEKEVSVGDFATFDYPLANRVFFGKDGLTMKCKALDDRMGCALLIELMRRIRAEKPSVDLDIYFCFTVGEETGHSGAVIASELISPDIALIFESTAIGDIPEAPSEKRVAEVSGGAVISVADRSTIYDKELIALAFATAKAKDIPLQVKRYLSGGNDAGHIHKSGVGVRSLAISVPTRYLHSPTCVAYYKDYESARDIAFELLTAIDALN